MGFFCGGFPLLGTLFGNGLIFAFAGHDTTGHTLTWMLMELCRNPATMEKLVAEVDANIDGVSFKTDSDCHNFMCV